MGVGAGRDRGDGSPGFKSARLAFRIKLRAKLFSNVKLFYSGPIYPCIHNNIIFIDKRRKVNFSAPVIMPELHAYK